MQTVTLLMSIWCIDVKSAMQFWMSVICSKAISRSRESQMNKAFVSGNATT
jgi:hypothetical protein